MRNIKRAIVHCSDTFPEWMAGHPVTAKRDEITVWHTRDRKWRDIGYHLVIDRDGATAAGRPISQQGAHVAGHNEDSIGICLLGGRGSERDDAPEQHFTEAQLATLRAVLDGYCAEFPGLTVHGHNEFSGKACPGFNVADWYVVQPTPAQPRGLLALLVEWIGRFMERRSQ